MVPFFPMKNSDLSGDDDDDDDDDDGGDDDDDKPCFETQDNGSRAHQAGLVRLSFVGSAIWCLG